MKTADPNSRGHMVPQPSTWRGRSEQNSLDQVGCEARKIPAEGDVFFLDFYLYRTYQALILKSYVNQGYAIQFRTLYNPLRPHGTWFLEEAS